MESLIVVASKVSTPLALGGLTVALAYLILRFIIAKRGLLPQLTAALSGPIIEKIISAVFVLALVGMVLGFAGYALDRFGGVNKSEDSVTLNILPGMSLRDAAKLISANDRHTAVFRDCTDAFLGSKVEPGAVTGRGSKELLETLQFRVAGLRTKQGYRVEHHKERGIYEIRCDK